MTQRAFRAVYGVDFSGAKLAGRAIWVAHAERRGRLGRLRLVALNSLEQLCGTADREPALAALVEMIAASREAVWGMDFPFGLPIEVMDDGCDWPAQLRLVTDWERGAYELGLWCVDRAKMLGGRMHIRRTTDTEAKTPFDCYHYRIIYQTFHGMRDVLMPLATRPRTAILPFQYRRLPRAERVVMESCPGSTLKRLGLPHQNYKQPAGGPLTAVRKKTRRAILAAMEPLIEIDASHRRTIMRNGGGDALDAVIAAVGVEMAWRTSDHTAIARHARYRREGYLYV